MSSIPDSEISAINNQALNTDKVLIITRNIDYINQKHSLSPECRSSLQPTVVYDDPRGVLFQQLPRILLGEMENLEWLLIQNALHQNRTQAHRGAQLANLCATAKKLGYHYVLDLRPSDFYCHTHISDLFQDLCKIDVLIQYSSSRDKVSLIESISRAFNKTLDNACERITGMETHCEVVSICVNLVRNTDAFLDFCILANPKSLDEWNYVLFRNDRFVTWQKVQCASQVKKSTVEISFLVRLCQTFQLLASSISDPEPLLAPSPQLIISNDLVDAQQWSEYWFRNDGGAGIIYGFLAGIFRRCIFKRDLEREVHRWFQPGSLLLHAGCGSGQVDVGIQLSMRLVAVDISPEAIFRYAKNVRNAEVVTHASIFDLPFPDSKFDGIYNLGVMEHFSKNEIISILGEFHRVLKSRGRILMFWPHRYASSVLVLKLASVLARYVDRRFKSFHPPEISLMKSQTWASNLMSEASFRLLHYSFGIRDGFVQTCIVAEKI